MSGSVLFLDFKLLEVLFTRVFTAYTIFQWDVGVYCGLSSLLWLSPILSAPIWAMLLLTLNAQWVLSDPTNLISTLKIIL